MAKRKLKVFLSYAPGDLSVASALYSQLMAEGWLDVWFDEERLSPGADTNLEIEKAISAADLAIICISKNATTQTGLFQKQLRLILDVAQNMPEGVIYMIPLKLEECEPPFLLRHLRFADYFEKEREKIYPSVLRSLQTRAKSIQILESDAKQYDLDIVNNMLRELSIEQLRTMVYEEFPPLLKKINWGSYTFRIISEVIVYAQDQVQVSRIVSWMPKNAPDIYDRFSSQLSLRDSIALKIGGNADRAAIVIGDHNVININRIETTNRFKNPYVAGNPIQPSNNRVFWGRLDIAEAIVQEIRGSLQKPSFLLYGRRRMGKTSALLNLRRLIKDIKILDVFISGQNAKFQTDVDFCFYLVDEIIKTTQKSLSDFELFNDSTKYFDPTFFESKPALALSLFFDEYYEYLEKNDLYCLLMLDEYEEFGHLSRKLLLQLREIMQHMPRFVFIFSGLSQIRELPNQYWGEVFVNVQTLKISFLRRVDGYKLLTEPVPELVYESDKIIEKMLDITGCQPFLLQAIAAELVNRVNLSNKPAASNQDLDFCIHRVFNSWQNYFDAHIWQKECSTGIHKMIVSQITQDKQVRLSNFSAHSLEVNDLIEKDILKIENDYLQLTMPIIGMWLNRKK